MQTMATAQKRLNENYATHNVDEVLIDREDLKTLWRRSVFCNDDLTLVIDPATGPVAETRVTARESDVWTINVQDLLTHTIDRVDPHDVVHGRSWPDTEPEFWVEYYDTVINHIKDSVEVSTEQFDLFNETTVETTTVTVTIVD